MRWLPALLLLAGLTACERTSPPDSPRRGPTHAEYAAALEDSALADTVLGRGWLDAARSAAAAPRLLELPYYERGAFLPYEARAVGIAFDAVDEQQFRIDVDLANDSTGRLFVQLFRIELEDGNARLREVASFTDLEGGVLSLAEAGRYILRLQPELLASIDYRLRVELAAALEFPVTAHGYRNIGSGFGDARDAGRRRHEGIDIIAARDTPVVAVAGGVARASRSELGGITVWLRGQGRSYYYAHLARTAIRGSERVQAGETLGYVGNTGNAITTPPHLHFAIYRRGRGAIDPVPYIAERTFATAPAVPDYEPGFAAVASARLNLRAGPGTGYARLDELPGGTPLQRLAASGEWLRVMTPLASNGWVHRDYLEPIENPGVRRTAEMDAWLLAAASGLAVPVSRLRHGAPLVVLADAPGWELVGTAEKGAVGWLGSRP
jgi:murein DD-endopeptidase MepM/ murein hydrolase activator NlpD